MSAGAADARQFERSLQKRFRRPLWRPFVLALQRYGLLREGDRVAVCLSGRLPSLALAKLFEELHRHSLYPFELSYLHVQDREEEQALPALFDALDLRVDRVPLRGTVEQTLLEEAERQGVSKLAVAACMDDVNETTLHCLLREGRIATLPPIEQAAPTVSWIRPLYCIHRRELAALNRYHGLDLPLRGRSALRLAEESALLEELTQANPNADISLFRAMHNAQADTFPKTDQEP